LAFVKLAAIASVGTTLPLAAMYGSSATALFILLVTFVVIYFLMSHFFDLDTRQIVFIHLITFLTIYFVMSCFIVPDTWQNVTLTVVIRLIQMLAFAVG
jgi:hypothetical protein